MANELRLQGVNVGVSGGRGVGSRHDRETRLERLLRLERHAQETALVRSDEQLRLLERHSVEFPCRHVEASRPGELLTQDTFFWGTRKGVGKVYVQVVVDVFCSLAVATVYTSAMPMTACDLLYDRVLPFYEALGVPIGAASLPILAANSAAGPRRTPTRCCSASRTSSMAPSGSTRPGPTASSSA